jgi:hypothetical protein
MAATPAPIASTSAATAATPPPATAARAYTDAAAATATVVATTAAVTQGNPFGIHRCKALIALLSAAASGHDSAYTPAWIKGL